MSMPFARSAPLALILMLTACTDFGGPIRDGEISPEEQRLRSIESKLGDVDRRLEAIAALDVAQSSVRLAEEVRSLRGDVEKLRFDLDNNERRARELYLDLDRRLQRLEGGGSSASGDPAAGGAGTSAGGAVTADPAEEQAYLAAFELLKAGKFDQSISGFKAMQEQWPRGRYADNAMYWVGEAQYVKREYAVALDSFNGLLQKFPSSAKAADALLKIGYCHAELKQLDKAKSSLQQVVEQYPNSSAAGLARARLDKLNRPG